jgi:hypothetical protein
MRVVAAGARLAVIALLIPLAAGADIEMYTDVVASGGGKMGNDSYVHLCTVGQGVIGAVAGPGNIHEIGFWYQPVWITVGVTDALDAAPIRFRLGHNYPNPFNPTTTIEYAVRERTHVTITLYDVTGREVETLVDEERSAGYHQVVLDASDLSSGIYYCRMRAGDFIETRKTALVK